jgi:hypothetical protein
MDKGRRKNKEERKVSFPSIDVPKARDRIDRESETLR